MKTWITYEDNGRIRGRMTGTEPTTEELAGRNYLEGNANTATHYILDGEVTPRPAFPITVSPTSFTTDETFTITGIPFGAIVTTPDGNESIEDGELEWSVTLAGQYRIELNQFPYLPEVWKLDVIDPQP